MWLFHESNTCWALPGCGQEVQGGPLLVDWQFLAIPTVLLAGTCWNWAVRSGFCTGVDVGRSCHGTCGRTSIWWMTWLSWVPYLHKQFLFREAHASHSCAGNNVHGQEAASGACRWYFVISLAPLRASVFPAPVKGIERWLILHMLNVLRGGRKRRAGIAVPCVTCSMLGCLCLIQRRAAQPFSLALPSATKIIWKPGTLTGQLFLSFPSLFFWYFCMLLYVQAFLISGSLWNNLDSSTTGEAEMEVRGINQPS